MFEKTLNLIQTHINNSNTGTYSLVTLVNGVHQNVGTERCRINGATKEVSSVTFPAGTSIETGSPNDVEAIVNRISLLWFFADYRRVKEHTAFRQLYSYGYRNVNYFDGNQVVVQNCETFPCARCGIVMPVHLTTIDHQKPQEGGELLAVLKLLRVLGMTVDGPKGVKGKAFAQFKNYNQLLSGILNKRIAANTIPHAPSNVPDPGKAARQTLNSAGSLFYSLCAAANDLDDLKKFSMHSVINLKPLCLRCNTSKGNFVLG